MHEPECGKQLNNVHLYFPVIAAVKNNLHQVTTQRGKKKSMFYFNSVLCV